MTTRRRHAAPAPTSTPAVSPPTAVDPAPDPAPEPAPEPAPGDARGALDRLAAAARVGRDRSQQDQQDEVVERATVAALAETATLVWRAIWIGVALFAVGIVAVVLLGLYTISINSDLADLTATGEVQANRTRAAAEVRGDPAQSCAPALAESVTLVCANRELAAVGLPSVSDPGPDASPSQVAAVLGEARAVLRLATGGAGSGGAPRSGVSSPPTTGRFPR